MLLNRIVLIMSDGGIRPDDVRQPAMAARCQILRCKPEDEVKHTHVYPGEARGSCVFWILRRIDKRKGTGY